MRLIIKSFFAKYPYIAVTLSAVLMALAQIHVLPNGWMLPPQIFGSLAWFALVPLLAVAFQQERAAPAFRFALLGCFLFFTATLYWITVAMSIFGGIPWVVSVLILCVLTLFLGSLMAFAVVAAHVFYRRLAWPVALTLPLAWAAMEHIRTYLFSGFPWANIADSQIFANPLLAQIAAITGENGVSWILIFGNVVIWEALSARSAGKSAMAFLTALALFLGYGAWSLKHFAPLAQSEGLPTVRLAAIQGNISQEQKWNQSFRKAILHHYQTLTAEARAEKAHLVVWPEAALPYPVGHNMVEFSAEQFRYLFGENRLYHLFGTVIRHETFIQNSAVLMNPEGRFEDTYAKSHLVPLGEYVPYKDSFLFFIDKVVPAIGDFKPGSEVRPIALPVPQELSNGQGSLKLGVLICYEDIFPAISRSLAKKGARVLVNMTNDAWYGRTSGPYQHLAISSYRALETRLPLLRATNTGISAVVSPTGAVDQELAWFKKGILYADIPWTGPTPSLYTRFGPWFSHGATLFMVFGWICNFAKRNRGLRKE